jgi:hypothetical protein
MHYAAKYSELQAFSGEAGESGEVVKKGQADLGRRAGRL